MRHVHQRRRGAHLLCRGCVQNPKQVVYGETGDAGDYCAQHAENDCRLQTERCIVERARIVLIPPHTEGLRLVGRSLPLQARVLRAELVAGAVVRRGHRVEKESHQEEEEGGGRQQPQYAAPLLLAAVPEDREDHVFAHDLLPDLGPGGGLSEDCGNHLVQVAQHVALSLRACALAGSHPALALASPAPTPEAAAPRAKYHYQARAPHHPEGEHHHHGAPHVRS
mmetsp:Transcript_5903/g.13576  ORF Transcript_5903/g.13576 Transcript_5903/m.13576 type:complete len:224 (+) Transcript_5903:262-933(+)